MKGKKKWVLCSIAVLLLFAVCFVKLRNSKERITGPTGVTGGLSSDNQKNTEQGRPSGSDASEESYTSPIDFDSMDIV